MTKPICTPDQKAKYIQWLRDGSITRMDLAERLHCSAATVGDWMHDANIPIRKPHGTPNEFHTR